LSHVVAKARERYIQGKFDAFRTAEARVKPLIEIDFPITEYSGRALAAVSSQWEPNRGEETRWDWQEIMRRHHDPDRFDMAIWVGDRLCALALAVTSCDALNLRFLEGSPHKDCPLAGRRALIAFEALSCYAQGRGRKELRVSPINSRIERLYIEMYGFARKAPRKQEPYLVKQV
jgi:hypothetical protein